MKALAALSFVMLTCCSSDPLSSDESYVAHRHFQKCVDKKSEPFGGADTTSRTQATSAVSACERELRVAAYLQAVRRVGKGDYLHASQVEVYQEWKDTLQTLALCRLSDEIKREDCHLTD